MKPSRNRALRLNGSKLVIGRYANRNRTAEIVGSIPTGLSDDVEIPGAASLIQLIEAGSSLGYESGTLLDRMRGGALMQRNHAFCVTPPPTVLSLRSKLAWRKAQQIQMVSVLFKYSFVRCFTRSVRDDLNLSCCGIIRLEISVGREGMVRSYHESTRIAPSRRQDAYWRRVVECAYDTYNRTAIKLGATRPLADRSCRRLL